MDRPKRIAIIGAGPSGLAAIKSCKEVGYEPTCFERNGEAGGLWKYHDEDTEGVPSVMKTTIMNTWKETTAFSDFPPPKEFPNYMHHSLMYKYLMSYAENFDLLRHIRYYFEVIKIEPTEDHEDTGRWIVSLKSSKTEAISKDEFDAVMVCVGHDVYPKVPTFPGQEKFRGRIMHSHSLKTCDQFSEKKVVVVGIGNSASDVAVESSSVAEKVYLSTRRGSWIFSRIGINGRPSEMDFTVRKNLFLRSLKPFDSVCDEIESNLNKRFDHDAYKLKPKHRVLSAHPTINDYLPFCIISGGVVVKVDIERFEENGVVFAGEDETTEVDTVILATGYLIKFPFLKGIISTEENHVELYKYAISPTLKHPTLVMIGLIQPIGPITPVAEMQSRWFLQVLMGNVKLPSVKDMMKEIRAKIDDNAKLYVDSTRHTIEADWITYMDELASQIGVKPNFWRMALTDPKLFMACYCNALLPYQYRLQGPHSWPRARDTLLGFEERVYTPLNSNTKAICNKQDNTSMITWLLTLIFMSVTLGRKNFHLFYRITSYVVTFPFNVGKSLLSKLLKH